MCRFNLLRHGEILSSTRHYPVMFENEYFPFLFVSGTPDMDDVKDFCCDVFADNKQVGQNLISHPANTTATPLLTSTVS